MSTCRGLKCIEFSVSRLTARCLKLVQAQIIELDAALRARRNQPTIGPVARPGYNTRPSDSTARRTLQARPRGDPIQSGPSRSNMSVGKPIKVAKTAVMRKPLILATTLVKDDRKWVRIGLDQVECFKT